MSAPVAGRPSAPRKRIWVQQVAVETDELHMRVEAARARGDLTPSQLVVADGVEGFIDKARAAAFRDDPLPGRLANWWRGTLVECAYRNMHTARAQLLDLYSSDELRAEIPVVVARADATLKRDDPRRVTVAQLQAESPASLRPRMRRIVGDSYEQLDLEHAQLRSFRNILLIAAMFIALVMTATVVFVALRPGLVPLCFPGNGGVAGATGNGASLSCPTGAVASPQGADVVVVAVLGLLGGALAAVLSIRHLKGTSTPYDVPVALAALKVPMGAMTAVLALIAIQGDFVPGLSALDSQGQILAYALVFGFAQQAFSRLLDQRAQTLLEGLPGGTGARPVSDAKQVLAPPEPTTASTASTPAAGVTVDAAVLAAEIGDRPVDEPEHASQEKAAASTTEDGSVIELDQPSASDARST